MDRSPGSPLSPGSPEVWEDNLTEFDLMEFADFADFSQLLKITGKFSHEWFYKA